MFADYELEVLRAYREKKGRGELLSNMMHPTPGKLKKEGLIVFDLRYDKKDERALRSFYELTGEPDTFRPIVKKWERDKFKMLNFILNGRQHNTDEKNIELLAWLIDFQPRPYSAWLKEQKEKIDTPPVLPVGKEKEPPLSNGEENKQEDNQTNKNPATQSPGKPEETDRPRFRYRTVVTYSALAIIIMLTGYYFLLHRPASGGNCMYWTGDHYERIACKERPDDTTVTVIGLDSNKMVHFKRDTRADTLTTASLGKIWYIKINGSLEYYTAPGEHPVYPDRRLLPLTIYILNKYPRKAG